MASKADGPWDDISRGFQRGFDRLGTGWRQRQNDSANGMRDAKRTSEDLDDELAGRSSTPSNRPSNMSASEYDRIRESSVHNPDAPEATLGKFADPPESYVDAAERRGDQYFSLGNDWGTIQNQYDMTDKDMFEAFNVPFLDGLIADRTPINFSHDPTRPEYQGSALADELAYILDHGYTFDPSTLRAELL